MPYYKPSIPKNGSIVATTLAGISTYKFERIGIFDWVIIDEAAKASLPETLPAIFVAKKVIMVGDQNQLPPMVENLPEEILEQKFAEYQKMWKCSLFEKLLELLPVDRKGFLDTQYRMAKPIGDLVSGLFYNGNIVSHGGIESVYPNLKWLNMKYGNQLIDAKYSMYNLDEALRIRSYILNELLPDFPVLACNSIMVLSPYKAQVSLLNKILFPYFRRIQKKYVHCKVATIDACQGQESDIVIYSSVRTKGNTEFLKDKRRLNVALSRAKKQFILLGKSEVLCKDKADDVETGDFSIIYQYSAVVDCHPLKLKEKAWADKQVLKEMDQWERMMKFNTLILNLGTSSVMKVIGSLKYKISTDEELAEHPIVSCLNVKDAKTNYSNAAAEAFCFPQLEKAIHEMKRNHNVSPDELYLLYTDRSDLLQPLQSILLYCNANGFTRSEKLCNILVSRINADRTKNFALYMKSQIEKHFVENVMSADRMMNIHLVGVGMNMFSSITLPAVKYLNSDEEIKQFLSLCDINREGFVYPAVYKALSQHIKTLKKTNIYCALRSGMGLLSQGVEVILDNLIPQNPRIPLQIPEDEEALVNDDRAGMYIKFFTFKKQTEQLLLSLDFEQAKDKFNDLRLLLRKGDILLDTLSACFESIKLYQEEACFDNIYLRLLNALYQNRYDQASIWLVSLIDYVFFYKILPTIQDEAIQYENKMGCYTVNSEKILADRIFYNTFKIWTNYPLLREYHDILLRDDQTLSRLNEIREYRYNLLKTGKSDSLRIKEQLLELLGISCDSLAQQQDDIIWGNIERIVEMESSLFGSECILAKLYKIQKKENETKPKLVLRQKSREIYAQLNNITDHLR